MRDPDFRAERRKARRDKLAIPAGKIAIRGYKRDWMFDDVAEIPPPINIDPLLVRSLVGKVGLMTPLTDEMTSHYNILPNIKSAKHYGSRHNKKYLERVRAEETDPQRIAIFEQGAVRSLEHTRDNLQWNLWLKKRIADWRLAYVDLTAKQLGGDDSHDTSPVRYAGEAIADVGYCLRWQEGLLTNVGQDVSLANAIEHVGHYASSGHPEILEPNMGLIELTMVEQEKRCGYWGARYDATREAFGNRLPDLDLEMDRDLDIMLEALYSQEAETTQVS